MARQRHLQHAPIREGLVDIQFEPPVPIERVREFAASVKGEFREDAALWQQALGVVLSESGPQMKDSEASAVGVRLAEPSHVLLARVNGFTYSRLAPYQDWEELRAHASAMWNRFVEVVRPETVNRTAVRYINVLPLPVDEDFSAYLNAPPIVPEKLPQGLASFLQRVVMVDHANGRKAIVTQAIEESQPMEARVQLFLDIDVFRVKRMNCSDGAVWDSLDDLRQFKNQIFFEHITEKTAEIFE